jgi:hypothetical protein
VRGSNPLEGVFGQAGKYTPATIVLVATNVVAFFAIASTHSTALIEWFGFLDPHFITRPWTFLTWPFVGAYHPINLLFASLWALTVCGSLERSWGTRHFLAFMAAVSALTALTLLIGGRILDLPANLYGLWVGIAAPTMAWCAINRFEKMCFWGFPIPAPLIAIFVVVLVWFEQGTPLRGLFALSGCAVGWWYGMNGRFAYRGYAQNRSPFDRFREKPGLRLVDLENDVRPGGSVFDRINPWRIYRSWRVRREVEKLMRRGTGTDNRDR